MNEPLAFRIQVSRRGSWRTRRGVSASTVARAASLADALYEDGELVRVIDADGEAAGPAFRVGEIAAARAVCRFLRAAA